MSRLSHQLAKAIVGACIASLALATGLVGGTGNAEAAVGSNPYLSTLSSDTYCNSATHLMSLRASITLDPAYFPNGAYVSFNFAYYQVDSAGRAFGSIYYFNGSRISTNPNDGWSTPVFMNTTSSVAINPFVPGGGGLMSSPKQYNGGDIRFTGNARLRTLINVRVNGATTGWRVPCSYQSYFTDSTGGHWATLSDCFV